MKRIIIVLDTVKGNPEQPIKFMLEELARTSRGTPFDFHVKNIDVLDITAAEDPEPVKEPVKQTPKPAYDPPSQGVPLRTCSNCANGDGEDACVTCEQYGNWAERMCKNCGKHHFECVGCQCRDHWGPK